LFANTNGEIYNYTYNADGIRTQKNIFNANCDFTGSTEYIYDGTKLIAESRNGDWLYYFYDANGTVTGMYYNNVLYYFRKNLQGDVTGIYNASGNIIAQYEYTPYGAILAITDANGNDISANATHIANINPIRYRGYYYDIETGFYYLQSRYYDPGVGRFINADAFVSTGQGFVGNNMFAYCGNNPIRRVDEYGTWFLEDAWEWTKENILEPIADVFVIAYDNVSASAGAGVGFGVSVEVGPIEASAEMREDLIGAQLRDGEEDIGNIGKSGASIEAGYFSVSTGNETFESWTSNEREVYDDDEPSLDVGVGFSLFCFVGVHAEVSFSISGFFEDIYERFFE